MRACVYTFCSLDTRVYVAQIHGLIITCTVWECIWRVIISNPKLVKVGTTLLMFNGTNTNMHTLEQSLCLPVNSLNGPLACIKSTMKSYYSGTPLKGHLCIKDTLLCPKYAFLI